VSQTPATMEDEYRLRSELGSVARKFVSLDDRLKEANVELKPFRAEKRQAKEDLVELMHRYQTPELALGDYHCELRLVDSKRKRRPTREELLDRCVERSGGVSARGRELFEFLFAPVTEETTNLRRKNLKSAVDDGGDDAAV